MGSVVGGGSGSNMYWVLEFQSLIPWVGLIVAAHPIGSKRAAEGLSRSLRLAGKAGLVVYDFDAPRGEGDFSE